MQIELYGMPVLMLVLLPFVVLLLLIHREHKAERVLTKSQWRYVLFYQPRLLRGYVREYWRDILATLLFVFSSVVTIQYYFGIIGIVIFYVIASTYESLRNRITFRQYNQDNLKKFIEAYNDVADNPPPRTAMQIKTTKPKIKQTALIFLCKCSLQQC